MKPADKDFMVAQIDALTKERDALIETLEG